MRKINAFWLKVIAIGMVLSLLLGAVGCATQQPATGVLRVALNDFGTDQLDPILQSSMSRSTSACLFDHIITLSPDDGSLAPGIAERWEAGTDGQSWTFYLREGVYWQDDWGEVTADDVKFSLERVMSPESKSPYAGSFGEAIKNIEAVDKYTVRIDTNGTVIDLPVMLSFAQGGEGLVVPKRYIEEKGLDEFRSNPIGSGPWKLVRHVPGSLLEFEAVEDPAHYKNHYRVMPAFQRLEIRLVPEEATRLAMLQTGEIDVALISGTTMEEAKQAGLQVVSIPFVGQDRLLIWETYRTPDLPTANLKVRQALNLAINRDEIVQYLLAGEGSAEVLPDRVFPFSVDIDMDYWKDYGKKTYTYDPERAKELLAEAGYADGFDLKMWSFAQVGRPWQTQMGEVLAGYFSEIGVRTQLVPVDWGTFRPYWSSSPHSPELDGAVAIMNSNARAVIPPSMYLNFHSEGRIGLLHSPEVDMAITGALSEPDAAKRREFLHTALQLSADSMVSIPISYNSQLVGVSDNVKWSPVPGQKDMGLSYERATHATK
ncbi:ABC transporter substrate-binding protein [Chloroflexota bacterium]